MRDRGFLAALLFLGILCISPTAFAKCTDARDVPNDAIYGLDTWKRLYDSYLKYGDCGTDGEVAEGYSDEVEKLFLNDWAHITTLAELTKNDKNFEAFVIYHINQLWSPESYAALAIKVKKSCPSAAKFLCGRIKNDLYGEFFNPPPQGLSDGIINSAPNTLKTRPANKINLGDFVVELEATTLADVQKTIGSGIIQHRGDAGGSEDWLCYSVPAQKEPQRIWFSSGEMGGDDHAILRVASKSGPQGIVDCPELPAKFRKISFGNALWLESDSGKLKTLFGEPSVKSGNWWIYSYLGKSLPGPQDNPSVAYDVTATVEAEVKSGKIVTLSISQVTSY